MNILVKLLATIVSIIAPPDLAGSMAALINVGYPGLVSGNRLAPGANGAFRRAAAKARRVKRG